MSADWLKDARRRKGWTQQQAADKLRVSQTYLSLLEQGRRPVTRRLMLKLQRRFDVPVTELPVEAPVNGTEAQQLAKALGALGYPGFSYLEHGKRRNPAEVLLTALQQPDLETRLMEALPWVAFRYPTLDWEWLLQRVKMDDLQNRLGFLLTLSRELADRKGDHTTAARLDEIGQRLERSRLAREDTLCRESMTEAERRWLRDQRPPAARHWNLLTDFVSERLPYAA